MKKEAKSLCLSLLYPSTYIYTPTHTHSVVHDKGLDCKLVSPICNTSLPPPLIFHKNNKGKTNLIQQW